MNVCTNCGINRAPVNNTIEEDPLCVQCRLLFAVQNYRSLPCQILAKFAQWVRNSLTVMV